MIADLLKDKVVLVTGASSGIGREAAIFFSRQGAQVFITGRNEKRLQDTLTKLEGRGGVAIIANIESPSEVERLVKEVINQGGPLDGVVHCAGIQKALPLKVIQEAFFDNIFDVNVKSAQFLAKSISKKGRLNSAGASLVFLSSVAAVCGEPAISTYSASKAALQGLSKSLALELASKKVRVNCIAPGVVETEMVAEFSQQLTADQYTAIISKHPLGIGVPEDVANAAAFLVSDMGRWITGTTLYVDGGYSAH